MTPSAVAPETSNRLLLVCVVAEEVLPFDVKVPNATTVKPMRAADMGQGKRQKSADALF